MNAAAALVLMLVLVLTGCSSLPPPPASDLFHDASFAPPSVPIVAGDAVAASPEMRRYVAEKIVSHAHSGDLRRRLVEVLNRKGELQLEYDAAQTRTAAQAFEARSGNCLSLVMMTAALAKEMNLTVRYQNVIADDTWDRADDLYLAIGHVNLSLSDRRPQAGFGVVDIDPLTIDFVPPREGRSSRTRVIAERTVVAMYLNNRAVESLVQGKRDDAYWWSREAIRTDPAYLSAYLTLGVVYRQQQHPEFADQALLRVIEREPGNTKAISNRVLVLRDLGRQAEASALLERLDALDPHPPFSYFNAGMVAWRERRFEDARRLFGKEVERAPYQHESQFWLAMTYLELRDRPQAAAHLRQAMEASTTRKDRDLYAAKLDRLKALPPQ